MSVAEFPHEFGPFPHVMLVPFLRMHVFALQPRAGTSTEKACPDQLLVAEFIMSDFQPALLMNA